MTKCNVTLSLYECRVGQYSLSIVPPLIQCLSGFIGNMLAIIILFKTSGQHKWKPFYRLVFALALTDSTVSIFVYPIVLKRYASDFKYCFTDYECKHVAFMYSFAFMGSALLVTSMSLDRFFAIVYPLTYNTSSKNLRVKMMIATSWVVTIVVCGVAIGVDGIKLYYPESWCFIDFSSHKYGDVGNIVVTYIYSVIGVIIFSITAITNTIVIVTMIRRIMQKKANINTQKRLKSDIFIVTFLLVIVIVFSVCWVPLIAVMLENITSDCPVDGRRELTVARLAITNSIVDPWIYIVLRKENFVLLMRIYHRCRGGQMQNRDIVTLSKTENSTNSENEQQNRNNRETISCDEIVNRHKDKGDNTNTHRQCIYSISN